MKYIRFILIFAVISSLFIAYFFYMFLKKNDHDPMIAVVLMVKNEESVIVETIQPFIEGGIRAFLIFDTGSTDKTIERAKKYFIENHISQFVIKQEPFVDFSTSRNRALELAEYHFPHAGFFIMPDAEWYISGAAELLAFCKNELEKHAQPHDVYALDAIDKSSGIFFVVPRLFRAKSHIRFSGVVHEIPNYHEICIRVPHVLIQYNPSDEGDKKTLARVQRDIALLSQELEKNPHHPRTLFYLAKSYSKLGDYHNAIKYYKERIAYEGFEEERFIAIYRIGQITEQLFFRHEATWEQSEGYYLQAFAFRPTRAEPLIHLANHYLHYHQPQIAYAYAFIACTMPYPDDSLEINKPLYDFHRWDILARAAEQLGQYELSKKAAKIALQAQPETAE